MEPIDPQLRDWAPALNASPSGWTQAMKVRYVRATVDEVECEIIVGPEHLQPYGLVHGGVYSGLMETLASVGAAMNAMPRGQTVVGLENHTSFLRGVREGTRLRCVALPLARGRRSQSWQSTITDEEGRVVATGNVRMLCLDPDAQVAGQTVAIKP